MATLTRAGLRRLLKQPQPYFLCHAEHTTHAGIFVPTVPELWGGTRGEQCLCVYRLCAACFAVPEREAKVEARIQAHLGARRN
jgi:hypothetical protein